MQAIIAGATGLIGVRLTKHWLAQGHTVTVIGRKKSLIKRHFDDRVQALTWDELTADCFREKDVVVNLAGAGVAARPWSRKRKDIILNSRIDTTQKIVQLLLQLGKDAPPLFNASAVGVYGLQQQFPDDLPPKLDEHTPLDFNNAPDFLSCVGRAWEKATRPLSESGVRVVNLRFGVVLAKKGGALPRIALPFYLFIGGKVGTGQQPFSWIQLDDVIRAFDFLMQNRELSGPINLVAPQCVTQQELAKAIGKVLHRPSVVPMPSIILKLFFGSMAQELLLEGQNVYPQRLLAAGFDFKCPDIESALKHIYVCHKHSE